MAERAVAARRVVVAALAAVWVAAVRTATATQAVMAEMAENEVARAAAEWVRAVEWVRLEASVAVGMAGAVGSASVSWHRRVL